MASTQNVMRSVTATRRGSSTAPLLFCAIVCALLQAAFGQTTDAPSQETAQTVMIAIILGLLTLLMLCLLCGLIAYLLRRRRPRMPVCEPCAPPMMTGCPMPCGTMGGPMMC